MCSPCRGVVSAKILNHFSLKSGDLDGGELCAEDTMWYLSVMPTYQFMSCGLFLARNAEVLVSQRSRDVQ